MPEAPERCSFEFDPEAWEREHDEECFVDPGSDDEDILTENADGDMVWRCPHETIDGQDECMFHLSRDSDAKPDPITIADTFLDISNGRGRGVNSGGRRPSRFIGAEFESLNLNVEQVGDLRAIDLRHTKIGSANWNVETIQAEPLDMRGVEIQSQWDCRDVSFDGIVRFGGTEFGGETWFAGAEFNRDARFSGVEFDGIAYFIEAEFGENVRFGLAEFSENARFEGTKFEANALFFGVKFSSIAQFGGNPQRNGAEFCGSAVFTMAEFDSFAWFEETKFSENVRFVGAEFNGSADFSEAKFGGDARFDRTEFARGAGFNRARFNENARFNNAEFGGNAGFRGTEFDEGATFTIGGWYPVSQFQDDTDFSGTTANGPLRFVDEYDSRPGRPYTFLGEVDFSGADVPEAEFSGVSFREVPTFEDADLIRADLSNSLFAEATFEGANLTRADIAESDVSGASFSDALLSQASLYGTDLTNARLYGARMEGAHISDNTDFGIRDRSSERRAARVPYEERLPRVCYDPRNPEFDQFQNSHDNENNNKIDDLARAAAVYAEIKRLAETNAASELASRCYRWRKDMQRRRSRSGGGRGNRPDRFRWLGSMAMNIVTRYGESYWRIGYTASIIVGICALLYYVFNLIEYSSSPSQSALLSAVGGTAPETTVTFLDALYFSTLTFSTLGMGTFQPSGPVGRAVAIFETLSGVVLLALLVFVFGRRATR